MSQTVKCKEPTCGQEFVVEDGEIAFLQSRFGADFKLPVRCKPCRAAKKQRMGQQGNRSATDPSQPQTGAHRDDHGNEGGRPKRKGKKRRRDEYLDD